MKGRLIVLLIGVGLFLQSCSVQKRSLMPGWHVVTKGQAAASVKAKTTEDHINANDEAVAQSIERAPSFEIPPAPLNVSRAVAAPIAPIAAACELQTMEAIQPTQVRGVQRSADVTRRYKTAASEQPPREGVDKKSQRSLVTIAALLGVAAIVAFDLLATPAIGLMLLALALVALRFAFPFTAPEPSEQPSVRADGIGKRIAMGVIGSVLGLASIPAFALGFLDLSTLPIALLGLLLVYLSLRAFMIAFPNSFPRLRARWVNAEKAQAQARKQRKPERGDEPSRDWLWLLALIPVALLILAVSSFSFPMFGM